MYLAYTDSGITQKERALDRHSTPVMKLNHTKLAIMAEYTIGKYIHSVAIFNRRKF